MTMKNKIFRFPLPAILLFAFLLNFSACLKDLDTVPLDPEEITSASVYEDPAAYKQVLAKLYAGLALSGQEGPAGRPDISGIDEGFSTYLRQYWKAQELPTDEAVIGWNDGSLPDYHFQRWTASNEFVAAMYYRIFYQISLCNEYLRETTDSKLSDRGVSDQIKADVAFYRAEARFLRALSYWHALDMFENVPFVTENDAVGSFLPQQTNAQDLFNYIESELKAIETQLKAPRSNELGRADQAAAWTLLAKLYLNAEVYIGQAKYTDCVTYCKKVIDAGYTLEPEYAKLFRIDNTESNEIIFSIRFDGDHGRTWGGMTFLVHAPIGGSMAGADFGVNGGWGGIRTTKQFVAKFDDTTGDTDSRAMFYTAGQSLEIDDIFNFTNGYAMTKYKNVDENGNPGSDESGNWVDTDFPMFRLADVMLMYAEAVKRGGGGGDEATALGYINALRERAYGDATGNVTAYDLPFILDERARELYWECHRRTDLRRFGQYTGGNYLWAWKGGVKDGISTSSHFELFPIPAADVIANPNLDQNDGY
ncbi:RagB/SusD family nutrient uptake outer membrane protein [Sphingobacteriales bacterium UPWRP_1]|nr:RagB/SusD family nutrient uptake outer membrane protein [Sphingobacteriales bacterium TSM_CSM]PSJ73341.1 RagB/SusD family nutrient uptake outer membrane protein [Sphingobacteriales bacterium UPWRP_1]